MVIESMQIPINRVNNMKFMSWMIPDSRNSVSVVAAVMVVISFERNDVLVLVAIGMDDQVNANSECWPPTLHSSNLGISLWLGT